MTRPSSASTRSGSSREWLAAALFLLGSPLVSRGLPQPAQPADTGVRIQILEQHADRLRLSYSVGSTIHGWTSAAPEDGSVSAGLLRSLCKTGVIGIPLTGEVVLEIVEVAPAGTFDSPVLASEEWDLPLDGPVFLGSTGFVRNQRVVQLNFAPKAVNGGGQVQLFSRVVADMYFTAAGSDRGGNRKPRGSWEERLYAQALINYEQATCWRQTRAAAKPAAQDVMPPDRLRITVRQQGMHRMTGRDLAAAGVPLSEIVPGAIKVLYGGGLTLGVANRPHVGIRLREIPVIVEDGGDGRFDEADAVLFYGEPAERWVYTSRNGGQYTWRPNPYTKDNVYFLEWNGEAGGLRAGILSGAPSEPAALQTDRYRERVHEEKEKEPFIQLLGIKSGYDWFWDTFRGNANDYSASLWNVVPGEPVDVRVRFWGFSGGRHQFELRWNDERVGIRSFTGAAPGTLDFSARQGAVEGLNQLSLLHWDNTATRLDWYELEYSRALLARNGEP